MADGFIETPIRGKHLHGVDIPDGTAVATLPAVAGVVDPSYTEGTLVALSTDLAGNLRVVISGEEGANGTLVDVTDRAARLLGITSLDTATVTALTSALESVDLNAATRDDLVTRLSTALEDVGLNGPTRDDLVDRIVAGFEASQVTTRAALEDVGLNLATRDDLVTRLTAALESVDLNAATLAALEKTTPQTRGADVDDSNPLPVVLQTNPGTLVDSGVLTDDNVAPGASTTLASAAVAGTEGRLVEITAHASVRMKVVVRANGVARRVFFTDPSGSPLVYAPADRDQHQVAGTQTFDVVLTNMDNLRTADLYASISHIEV